MPSLETVDVVKMSSGQVVKINKWDYDAWFLQGEMSGPQGAFCTVTYAKKQKGGVDPKVIGQKDAEANKLNQQKGGSKDPNSK